MNLENTRRRFIRQVGALACGAVAGPSFAQSNKRPNLLFIMSDDHAAHAIGAYGGRFAPLNPTPNLDQLASEGVRLDNVYKFDLYAQPRDFDDGAIQPYQRRMYAQRSATPRTPRSFIGNAKGGLRNRHDRQVAFNRRAERV